MTSNQANMITLSSVLLSDVGITKTNLRGYYIMSFNFSIKSKVPTALIIVFTALQIVFGFDYGFSRAFRGRIGSTVKYLTLFSSFLFVMVYLSPIYFTYHMWWWWINFINYIATSCVLKLAKYNVYDYLKDVHEFGKNIPVLSNNVVGIIFTIYILVIYEFKFLILFLCSLNLNSDCNAIPDTRQRIAVGFFHCIIDSASGSNIIVGFYLYSHVKYMKDLLKCEKNLVMFEQNFLTIANCHDKIYPLYKNVILIELFVNTPRILATIWCILFYIKENAQWYYYTIECIYAFHLIIQMFIPAVLAEMVNVQVDSIKMFLNEQRRVEKDKEKSEEITRVLRYVKARRLQNDIWRVIPVDLRLPLSLFSFCTTYFIVILQFTHLYD